MERAISHDRWNRPGNDHRSPGFHDGQDDCVATINSNVDTEMWTRTADHQPEWSIVPAQQAFRVLVRETAIGTTASTTSVTNGDTPSGYTTRWIPDLPE